MDRFQERLEQASKALAELTAPGQLSKPGWLV